MTESPDKSMIYKYLLGDLPEKDLVAIEDAAFESEQQVQAIQAAENDLIDEYVRGELSEHDRRLFEQRFLASAERRRKIEFAHTFFAVAPEFKAKATVTPKREQQVLSEAVGNFWGLFRVPKFALVAAAVLLVLGVAWLLFEVVKMRSQIADQQARANQERILQQQIDQERARSEQLASQLRQEQQQRQQAEQLLDQVKETTPGNGPETQHLVATLALLAGIPRGNTQPRPKLQLQQGTTLVRLQVEVDPADDYKTFEVDLHDDRGASIWTRGGLVAHAKRGGKTIVITLPASLFKKSGYELSLKGVNTGGTNDDLGFYYFDVVRR